MIKKHALENDSIFVHYTFNTLFYDTILGCIYKLGFNKSFKLIFDDTHFNHCVKLCCIMNCINEVYFEWFLTIVRINFFCTFCADASVLFWGNLLVLNIHGENQNISWKMHANMLLSF